MATRADRLPALRRLAADPGATPPERALAARLAGALARPAARPRSTPSAAPRGARVVLDCSDGFPWLLWRCPWCGEPVGHPGDRTTHVGLLALAAALRTSEDARHCFLCAVVPSPLTLDGCALPGAVPVLLWRVATAAPDAGAFLVALGAIRAAYQGRDLWGSRRAWRRRIRGALDVAVAAGALSAAPPFQIRAHIGQAVVRWRRGR